MVKMYDRERRMGLMWLKKGAEFRDLRMGNDTWRSVKFGEFLD
jgi:hypothetical protein